jgi:hypothetical protein
MQTFNIKSDVTEDSTGKKIKLVFTGYLTLQNAKEIKSVLQNQSGDFMSVELMAKEVAGIDVSFLQIVESYRKANHEGGKKVKILMDLPYDLKTMLANAGIEYPIK